MFRTLIVSAAMTLCAIPALADVQFQNFSWKADNGVELQVLHNRAAKILKGELKDGETRELAREGLNVTVISHSNSFLTLAFIEAGVEAGGLIVLERQNSQYVPLTPMIPGRATTLVADIQGALAALKKINQWDHSLALRSMVSYFAANSGKNLNDFYDAVELGHVKLIAKPVPRVEAAQQPRRVRNPAPQPAPPSEQWQTEVRPEPKRQPRVEEPWAATVERRKIETPPEQKRVPLPYEPRYSGYNPNYPGQNMRRDGPPPNRRRPRTMFDLLYGN